MRTRLVITIIFVGVLGWTGAYLVAIGGAPGGSVSSPTHVEATQPLVVASGTSDQAMLDKGNLNAAGKEGIGSEETSIGSEGYGPHVLRALNSGDATRAGVALKWLTMCRVADQIMAGADRLRSMPKTKSEVVQDLINRTQTDLARCQTVTPDIAAKRPELALIALRGGYRGAATDYLFATNLAPDPAVYPDVVRALDSDARHGDRDALVFLGSGVGNLLGLTSVQRRSYELAASKTDGRRIDEGPFVDALQKYGGTSARLTPVEEQQAEATAAEILVEIARTQQPARRGATAQP